MSVESIIGSILPIGGSILGSVVGGPLGSAVGYALGSGISGSINSSEDEKKRNRLMQSEYDLSMQAAQQQHQWSIEDWERQNAYNHPAEQIKRLEEAGLNPLLTDVSGGLSSLPSASTAVSAHMPESSLGYEASMMDALSQLDVRQAQAENLRADTEFKKEKSETERSTRELVKDLMRSEKEVNDSVVKLNIAKQDEALAHVEEINASVNRLTQETTNLQKEFELLDLSKQLKQKEVDWYDDRVKSDLMEAATRMGLNRAQASAAVASAQLMGEQYNTQVQITRQATTNAGIARLNFDFYDKTQNARVNVEVARGQKAKVYLDTPEWTKDVQGFTDNVATGVTLFTNYLKMGSSAVEVAGGF